MLVRLTKCHPPGCAMLHSHCRPRPLSDELTTRFGKIPPSACDHDLSAALLHCRKQLLTIDPTRAALRSQCAGFDRRTCLSKRGRAKLCSWECNRSGKRSYAGRLPSVLGSATFFAVGRGIRLRQVEACAFVDAGGIHTGARAGSQRRVHRNEGASPLMPLFPFVAAEALMARLASAHTRRRHDYRR